MSDETPANYQALIDRKPGLSIIMIEDAAMDRLGDEEEYTGPRTALKPEINDPKLNFVVDTVLMAHSMLPEITLEERSMLDDLEAEEKEARIVGYMARETLNRFNRDYPNFQFELSDIVHDGFEHPEASIRELVAERAPQILKAIDMSADVADRMYETKKFIY